MSVLIVSFRPAQGHGKKDSWVTVERPDEDV